MVAPIGKAAFARPFYLKLGIAFCDDAADPRCDVDRLRLDGRRTKEPSGECACPERVVVYRLHKLEADEACVLMQSFRSQGVVYLLPKFCIEAIISVLALIIRATVDHNKGEAEHLPEPKFNKAI